MKAVLDACVLYPTVLREILIGVADAGLYTPVWSPRILAEWRHAAARLGADAEAVAGAEIALLTRAHAQASIPDDGMAAEGFDWPDPADRHVAEAAPTAASRRRAAMASVHLVYVVCTHTRVVRLGHIHRAI